MVLPSLLESPLVFIAGLHYRAHRASLEVPHSLNSLKGFLFLIVKVEPVRDFEPHVTYYLKKKKKCSAEMATLVARKLYFILVVSYISIFNSPLNNRKSLGPNKYIWNFKNEINIYTIIVKDQISGLYKLVYQPDIYLFIFGRILTLNLEFFKSFDISFEIYD